MSLLITLRRRWALTLSLLVALGLLWLLVMGMMRDPRELPSVLIGKPWPEMALPRLDAVDGDLVGPEQLRGKARLINVWASWCAVCIDEQPVMMALARTLRDQGRADQLIGLSYKDDMRDSTAWLRRYGNPFSMNLVDAKGRMGIELGVYGAPETYIIDAQGIIVWKHVGAVTHELVRKEILPRLGADAQGVPRVSWLVPEDAVRPGGLS
uniref:DsbE family thiol:disulfide interchange protein n=1 Tax=Castellaniella defragrans TaxID=75697 RepID=UPI00333F231D